MTIERVERKSWFSKPTSRKLESGDIERIAGPTLLSIFTGHPIKTELEIISPDKVVVETKHVGKDSLFSKNATCPRHNIDVFTKEEIGNVKLYPRGFRNGLASLLTGRKVKLSWEPAVPQKTVK